jgi:putative transposase
LFVGATCRVAHDCDGDDNVGARCATPNEMAEHGRATQWKATQRVAPTGPVSGSVGAIIGQFKSAVTKRINQIRDNPGVPVWQRNYFERVIRNDRELATIREYIVNNPMKWAMDKENPANCPV